MMERKKESSCIKVAFSITHTTDPIMILPGGLAVFQVNSHITYRIWPRSDLNTLFVVRMCAGLG